MPRLNVGVAGAVTVCRNMRHAAQAGAVPQNSTSDVPMGAEPLAVIVATLLPVVVGFGLNVAVTPGGSAAACIVTGPAT